MMHHTKRCESVLIMLTAVTCLVGRSDASVPLTPHTPGHVAEEDGVGTFVVPSSFAVTPAKAVLAFEAAADSTKGKLTLLNSEQNLLFMYRVFQ